MKRDTNNPTTVMLVVVESEGAIKLFYKIDQMVLRVSNGKYFKFDDLIVVGQTFMD